MRLLFGKLLLYVFLIFVFLEIIVRVFNLYQEHPLFIINDENVKTYAPNNKGQFVVGNRKMNFSEYNINNSGFNSYREFTPSKNKFNIALIGDSFIEGLHQNYYNSIGNKIERKLNNNVEVFEYGHAGYDFADQLHLISAYKEKFKLIDKIIIYLKFENDLKRDFYEPDQYWVDTQNFPLLKLQKKIKLISYAQMIGALEPLKDLKTKVFTVISPSKETTKETNDNELVHRLYIKNFKTLIDKFGINKNKTIFLLDANNTPQSFLSHCDMMHYNYIDFSKDFEESKKPTTLIYDLHWNNHGRKIIAKNIVEYINLKKNIKI